MKNYHEVENPKQDIEYWVVVDEELCIPHYFKTEKHAQEFGRDFGHTIIFKECFN